MRVITRAEQLAVCVYVCECVPVLEEFSTSLGLRFFCFTVQLSEVSDYTWNNRISVSVNARMFSSVNIRNYRLNTCCLSAHNI